MGTSQVIVLNGASSSGKSSIATELQTLLSRPYLRFGVDVLIEGLPTTDLSGIGFAAAQAPVVHRGVEYDIEVDTTTRPARECAEHIVARLAPR
jgi:chloramphenicol 3-O-phosphotransferase